MIDTFISARRLRLHTFAATCLGFTVMAGAVQAEQRDIVIGAHEAGSHMYASGAAIAGLITKHTKQTGKVLAVAGSGVWMPMMEAREVDLGLLTHYQGWLAYVGKKPFPRKFDIRTALIGGGIAVGLYVRNSSPIKTRKDIRGKRIGYKYSGAPAIGVYAEGEIANAGLTWKDVKAIPRTSLYAGQREDVTERRLDVFYASVGSGISRELDSTIGIRFLGLDTSPAALANMRKVYPAVVTRVKAGPPGIREDMTLVYLSTYLVAYTKVSDDVVYRTVKTLWEHNAELRKSAKRLRGWSTDKFASEKAIIPYHDGAIRLYKEKGVWTPALAKRQKELLAGK
ncbi:MAG: TAXI family TRAP transporter solute-binding subunit [Alphaproteobacteria bacterium]|nr:TAXI family TRAP transporter solute-binding subunit [Alphaproteobacteria bacterium]